MFQYYVIIRRGSGDASITKALQRANERSIPVKFVNVFSVVNLWNKLDFNLKK